MQELFLTVADLKSGETIEFAPYPSLPATVTHARLVPLTDAERAAWQKDTAKANQLLDEDEYRAGLERMENELPKTVEYTLEWLIAVAYR